MNISSIQPLIESKESQSFKDSSMTSSFFSEQLLFGEKPPQKEKIFHISKIKNKRKWTPKDDAKLIRLAAFYQEKHWKKISSHFQNKNALQCFSRYKRVKPGVLKGHWTNEEDNKILEMVKIFGKSWSKIAKILQTRNGKQIRDRFTNVLDPAISKNKFTDEEDKLLMKLYMMYGAKWSQIVKKFPNRTADMIKNRFHSSIKKLFFSQEKKACYRQTKTLKRMKMKKELIKKSKIKICTGNISTSISECNSPNKIGNTVMNNICFSLNSSNDKSVIKENVNVNKLNSIKEEKFVPNNNAAVNSNVNEGTYNEMNDGDSESQNNNMFTIGDDDYFNY